ncbi:MAG: nucleoside triphosphate pyrophosphohydrolase [Longimicrobiales bacterium]|jgi:MazG family protein|nr:nucleoside triphosphate pyrophosphohydrolase [Gemmatimonadales bacterium]MBT4913446.1 nucleoside triphosphate pyrophosphohydrolase [Gemmatimonadales bacterium]MDG2238930.1 nucleoside triphosphate pyrophosphohydrolase [Longimicrobiales bacterium]
MSEPETDTVADTHHFAGPGTLDRALRLVEFLRKNCPWDAEQTAESLIPHLLEETHEVVDAIREGSPDELAGELGDLLLNLAFQIVVAEEKGDLDSNTVYGHLEEKMIRRHPHLFGNGEKLSWEALKAEERGSTDGALNGLAKGLDPLTKSFRIQERVASVGFDWDDFEGPYAKVKEELLEVRGAIEADDDALIEEEIGDLLFAVVNLSRLVGRHPTTALASANEKFKGRFEALERLARERGIDVPTAGLPVLDGLWDELKAREASRTD